MKKVLLTLLLISTIFVIGCYGLEKEETVEITSQVVEQEPTQEASVQEQAAQETTPLEPALTITDSCSVNADCTKGDLCIDGTCNSVGALNAPIQQ